MRRARRVLRPVLVLTTAAVVAVGLTACGSSSDPTEPSAGATAAATGGAQATNAATTDDVLKRVAEASARAATAKAAISTSGPEPLAGEGVFRFGDPAAADYTLTVEQNGQEQEVRLVLVDDALYLKLDGLGSAAKPWVKVSGDGSDPISRSFATVADSLTQAGDVSSNLRLLEAGATVTRTGEEAVDGVAATRYRIVTDVAKAEKAATGTQREGLAALRSAGVRTLTADLWVGPDDLPVKYEQTTTVGGQEVTTTVRYSDWGKAVTITPPPASQVGSLPGS